MVMQNNGLKSVRDRNIHLRIWNMEMEKLMLSDRGSEIKKKRKIYILDSISSKAQGIIKM